MARSTFQNFFATTLTAGINGTDVNADVVTTGTLSAPCYIVISPRDPANREVWYATTVTSTRFTVSSTSDRYLAGSAKTSGQTHPIDAEVWCVPLGQHLDDLWDAVDAKASDSHDNTEHSTNFATQSDFAGHEAKTDAHSATAAATASRIVLRDANARAKVADPSADGDIVNLGYLRGYDVIYSDAPSANTTGSITIPSAALTVEIECSHRLGTADLNGIGLLLNGRTTGYQGNIWSMAASGADFDATSNISTYAPLGWLGPNDANGSGHLSARFDPRNARVGVVGDGFMRSGAQIRRFMTASRQSNLEAISTIEIFATDTGDDFANTRIVVRARY